MTRRPSLLSEAVNAKVRYFQELTVAVDSVRLKE